MQFHQYNLLQDPQLITRNGNFNQYRQVIGVEKGKSEKESVN